jgi:hypothetical protein
MEAIVEADRIGDFYDAVGALIGARRDKNLSTTAYGASSSLPPIPAKVASPNRQWSFRLGGGNWSSCPSAAIRGCTFNLPSWVGFPTFANQIANGIVMRRSSVVIRNRLHGLFLLQAGLPLCRIRGA